MLVTYKLGVRRFDHERELDERGDARSTLAAGALELDRLKNAIGEMFGAFGGSREFDDFSSEMRKISQAAEGLESALAGIRIRFKQDSDVVVEVERALATMQQLMLYQALSIGGDPEESEYQDEVTKMIVEFAKHRDSYLNAAQKVVGVHPTEN